MTYEDYLRSDAWKTLRAAVIARDGGRCVTCNTAEGLQVHHRTYERRGQEQLADLTTLCHECHGAITALIRRRRSLDSAPPFPPPPAQEEISPYQFRVFAFMQDANRWVTNAEIAQGAQVVPRTVRALTRRLVHLGLFEQAAVFPAYRYRLSPQAADRNKAYLTRLQQAQEVFADARAL